MRFIPRPDADSPASASQATLVVLYGLAVAGLAVCAAPAAGSRGHASFKRESVPLELTGTQQATRAAACFEEQAGFLPLSELSRDGGSFTYRLRVSNLWFEQVRIDPNDAGVRAEIRLVSNLDARWRAQFEADRLQPPIRCLAP